MTHYHFKRTDYGRERGVLASATLASIAGTIGVLAVGGGVAAGTSAVLAERKKAEKKRGAADIAAGERRKALLATLPQPEDAAAKARTEIARRRRITALAGGKTLLTTETGIGAGDGLKTLLGQ